jgi:hypothetical protein
MPNEWSPLTAQGTSKFVRVFSAQFPTEEAAHGVTANKFGRKTIFCRDSGVLRLYCAGDDGYIYSLKLCCAFPPPDEYCWQLFDAAAGLISDVEYVKLGVYKNGRLMPKNAVSRLDLVEDSLV